MTRFADLAALPEHLRAQVEAKLTGRVTTHRIRDDASNGWTPGAKAKAAAGARKSRAAFEPEAVVLRNILKYLEADPRVRWSRRLNSGAAQVDDKRFVRFGFVGCPDVIGQLKDGRCLFIEVKSARGTLTKPQAEFLAMVRSEHTLAGIARSLDDLRALLG